jgi:hypothetical protein
VSALDVGTLQGSIELDIRPFDTAITYMARQLQTFAGNANRTGTQAGQNFGTSLSAGAQAAIQQLARSGGQLGGPLGQQLGQQAGRGLSQGIADGADRGATAARRSSLTLAQYIQNQSGQGIQQGIAQGAQQGAAQAGQHAGGQLGSQMGQHAQGGVAGGVAQGAQQGAQQGARAGSELGSKMGVFVVKALMAAGIGKALEMAMDAQGATSKIQAQLNLTSEQTARAGKIAGKLWIGNYADSVEDGIDLVAGTISSLGKSMDDLTDDQIQRYAAYSHDLTEITGEDADKINQLISRLLSTGLAKSADEAFDVVTRASQDTTMAMRGDLLDVGTEYAATFAQLGISGSSAFAMIAAASKDGAINMDKVGDSLKEFTVLSTDLSTAKQATQDLGLSYQDLANDVLAGGTRAQGALNKVVTGLLAIKDPAKQANDAIQLFGTPLEDLGTAQIPAFLRQLQQGQQGLGEFAGAAAKADQQLGSTARGSIATFGKNLQSLGMTVGQDLLPVLDPALNLLGTAGGIAGKAASAFGAMPKPLQDSGLALGALLFFRNPLNTMLTGIAQKAALATYSLGASGLAGAAATGLGGISKFAGFLGGPWGFAFAGAGAALISWISNNNSAAEATEHHRNAVSDLTGTVNQVSGALTAASANKITDTWVSDGTVDKFKDLGLNAGEAAAAITKGGGAVDDYRAKLLGAVGGIDGWLKASDLSSKQVDSINRTAKMAGVSVADLITAFQEGGPAAEAMAKKILDGEHAAGFFSMTMDQARSSANLWIDDVNKGGGALSAFNQEVGAAGDASATTAAKFQTAAAAAADLVKVDPGKFTAALQAAAASGESVENVLKDFGVTGQGPLDVVLGSIGTAAKTGGDGMHYLSDAAAAAAKAGTAAATASGQATAATQKQATVIKTAAQLKAEEAAATAGAARQEADYVAGLRAAGAAQKSAQDSVAGTEQAMKNAAAATERTNQVLAVFSFTVDQLSGRNRSVEEATKLLNDQVRSMGEAFKAATEASDGQVESLIDAKGHIDTTTQAGSDLYESVDQYRAAYDQSTVAAARNTQAQKGTAEALKAGRAAADEARKKFLDQAAAQNVSKDKAEALADAMGILEGKKLTPKTLGIDATDNATPKVDTVDKKKIGDKKFDVDANTEPALAKLRALAAQTIATSVATIAGSFLGKRDGGLVSYYAAGGVRENHVAQIAPAGAMRVWAEPETRRRVVRTSGTVEADPVGADHGRRRETDGWALHLVQG